MFRFSTATREILESAGWSVDRDVDIGAWVRHLMRQGIIVTPMAERLLRSLGGIEVHPQRGPDSVCEVASWLLDPLAIGDEVERASYWRTRYGKDLVPLGEIRDDLRPILSIDAHGALYSGTLDLCQEGASVEESIESLCLGTRLPRELAPVGPER